MMMGGWLGWGGDGLGSVGLGIGIGIGMGDGGWEVVVVRYKATML